MDEEFAIFQEKEERKLRLICVNKNQVKVFILGTGPANFSNHVKEVEL